MSQNYFGIPYNPVAYFYNNNGLISIVWNIKNDEIFHDTLYTIANFLIKNNSKIFIFSSTILLDKYNLEYYDEYDKVIQDKVCHIYRYKIDIKNVLNIIDKNAALQYIEYLENEILILKSYINFNTLKSARNI